MQLVVPVGRRPSLILGKSSCRVTQVRGLLGLGVFQTSLKFSKVQLLGIQGFPEPVALGQALEKFNLEATGDAAVTVDVLKEQTEAIVIRLSQGDSFGGFEDVEIVVEGESTHALILYEYPGEEALRVVAERHGFDLLKKKEPAKQSRRRK